MDVTPPPERPQPLSRKLLWFVALWLLGTGTVAVFAYILRLWIAPH
ncbi:DUF2474 domain-containing protein [Afipia massiliensis]|uniref:DUF2474 domain-containing protein n=1 Tax=Afipia massiliensis TaxID=211460 RepID=A0A4U6BRU3_9BRAD|nr:DUF2474 domain-containing protein [Afipia massiliensis]